MKIAPKFLVTAALLVLASGSLALATIFVNQSKIGAKDDEQIANVTSSGDASFVGSGGLRASDSPDGVSIGDPAVVDTTPPKIGNLSVSNVTKTGVTVTWITDEYADQYLEYGLTTSYGQSSLLSSDFGTSHTINLSSLSPNTTYNFRVKSKDLYGNLAVSNDSTFTTAGDVVQFFTLSVNKAGTGSGTVMGGSINCGTSCTQGNITPGTSITLSASAAQGSTFGGWSGGGCSGNGSCVLSMTGNVNIQATFTSDAPVPDGTPDTPQVLGIHAISGRQINLSWNASLGEVRAKKYDVYRNGTYIGSTGTLDQDHIWKDAGLFQDVGLTPNTTYSYYVKAVSAGGNESPASRTVSARTKASSEVSIIPSNRIFDWTPGVNVGVPGGIPTDRTNIIDISKAPYFASGSLETTSGTAAEGSFTITLSAVKDFKAGQLIRIKDAGRNIYVRELIVPMTTKIESISGNVATLRDAIQAPVTNTLVEHDDGSVIGQAIADAPANSVVYIPAGIYRGSISINKDNITVRGAGVDRTIIDCTGGCAGIGRTDGYYNMPYIDIVEGAYKGSTRITVTNNDRIGVGTMLRIASKRDIELPDMGVTGGHYARGQEVIVTAKSGNTLTINIPLMAERFIMPTAQPSAGYVSFSGVEDITLDANRTRPTFANGITCYGCWFKNVKMIGAGNYTLSVNGVMNEVRHSYLGEQAGAGTNHAGLLGAGSGFLFEDNIIDRSQPLIEINGGSAGNVFAYNFLKDGVVDTNHAPHNQYNLYEGNYIAGGIMSDGYFGGESENTIFRNGMTSAISLKRFSRNFNIVGNYIGGGYSFGQPNIGNGSSEGTVAPSTGVYWFDWNKNTGPGTRAVITRRIDDHKAEITIQNSAHAQRLFNYCQALGGFCMAFGFEPSGADSVYLREVGRSGNVMTVETFYNNYTIPTQGTEGGIWPRSEGFQELDIDVHSTTLLKANKYGNGSGYFRGINESLQPGEVLPDSLYLNGKPAWFGNLAWPPYGPNTTSPNPQAIPAGYRYYNENTQAPGVTNIGSNPVTTPPPAVVNNPTPVVETQTSVPTQTTTPAPTTNTTADGSRGSVSNFVNKIINVFIPSTPQKSTQTNPTPAGSKKSSAPASTKSSLYITPAKSFTLTLNKGSIGSEVVLLQTKLASSPGLYPEKKISGVFDAATERAVQRFQDKYSLAAKGEEGYGVVGPKTRAKLNALWGAK